MRNTLQLFVSSADCVQRLVPGKSEVLMTKAATALLLLAGAVTAWGCGDSDGPEASDPPPAPSDEEYARRTQEYNSRTGPPRDEGAAGAGDAATSDTP
jgi:hypothetical protein